MEEVQLMLNLILVLILDNAANDIRERVARVVDNLPSESDPPQILKRAAGFTTTMWLSLIFIDME